MLLRALFNRWAVTTMLGNEAGASCPIGSASAAWLTTGESMAAASAAAQDWARNMGVPQDLSVRMAAAPDCSEAPRALQRSQRRTGGPRLRGTGAAAAIIENSG